MALSAATIPTIVSSSLLESLKANLVYARLFNENYIGNVAPGNVVKIPSISAVETRAYTSYTPITADDAADASISMTIDKQRYFSIILDDIDAAMAKPAVLAAYVKEAAFQLQNDIDKDLATTLSAGTLVTGLGTASVPIEVNSANIASQIRTAALLMDNAKVPREGRYAVLPPWAVEKLTIANVATSTNNVSELANGFVARYAGFDVLMSANVPNTTSTKYKIVFGSPISATYAVAINKAEVVRHPTLFADNLRGLAAYGSALSRAGAVAVAIWNCAAES